jgi:hypothetical protein
VAPKIRSFGLTVVCFVLAGLVWPAHAEAQRRAVRRPAIRGAVVVRTPVYYPRYYYPRYYYPGAFSPFYYDPFFWGWSGYGQWGYPPPYYWGTYDRTGAARLQVTPRETQVFIDGYFVGTADQFDGAFQRLRVEAGEHELELYLEGYRTVRQPVLFRRDGTLTLRYAMEPLGPGETSERPVPPASATRGGRPDAAGPGAGRPDAYRNAPGGRRPTPPRAAVSDFGTLDLRVQPEDAEILIDGERWDSSGPGSRLVVQLAEGPHQVEIRQEGYRPYTANIRITRGQTETLNVSLSK